MDLKELHILKMPRVLQSLFYLLRYDRSEICEKDTNKVEFKKVKALINDQLFERMSKYQPFGQSEATYKQYQKLSFIKKNIDSLEEDKVDDYSVILGRIFRWVSIAVDLRIEDVKNRRDKIAFEKYER